MLMLALRILTFTGGATLVIYGLYSAIVVLVLPRSAANKFANMVFLTVRSIFDTLTHHSPSYEARDRIMALYAPISVLLLLPAWLLLELVGFMGIFWAIGVEPLSEAYKLSGSSLLTLGFSNTNNALTTLVAFIEATIGLILVALLIAYLPTMYSAFARREAVVNMLEVRAGSPPSAVEMLIRFHRIGRLATIGVNWTTWELWFVDLDESHTSLGALSFFRSPDPRHSWVTAAGAILDAAALTNALVDVPHDPQADLTIRAGYLALRHIASFFRIPYVSPTGPGDPISISREEFDAACAEMEDAGVPLKADRDQAWRDFAGWRVNYDQPLLGIAGLIMAPYARWSSDRSLPGWRRPRLLPRRVR